MTQAVSRPKLALCKIRSKAKTSSFQGKKRTFPFNKTAQLVPRLATGRPTEISHLTLHCNIDKHYYNKKNQCLQHQKHVLKHIKHILMQKIKTPTATS